MNLPQLYYFRKLAQIKHYTRAAEELYITQPALSNSISQLEKELGIPLFERRSRQVELTKYGREFLDYASEAINVLEKGKAVAKNHNGLLTGTVDIGTIYTIQADYLPALIRSYRAEYGAGPIINMYQGLTGPLVDDLEDGRYDLVFGAYVPNKPELKFVPILSEDLVLLAHPDDPLADADEVDLQALRERHVITYRPGTSVGEEVDALLTANNIEASEVYDDEITLASMVVSDPDAVGIALDTIGLLPFPELTKVKIAGVGPGYHPIYVIYRRGAYKTPTAESFIDKVLRFRKESGEE